MPVTPTNAAFLAAIQAMTVTGVDRYYDEPPASMDISDGEAAFPVMMASGLPSYVSTCASLGKTRSIGFVIVVEATGQGTQAQNYAKLAGLMDALETALDALTIANYIEYTITTTGNYNIGDSAYLAVVAEISARSA